MSNDIQGILNHTVNDSGLVVRAVVLNGGVPKPVVSMSIEADTSIQAFEAGDDLITKTEGEDTYAISHFDPVDQPHGLYDVVDNEVYHQVVMDFLDLKNPEDRYFILEGEGEMVNGVNYNELFKTHVALADLLDGLDDNVKQLMTNWIARGKFSLNQLDWGCAYALSDIDTVPLSLHFNKTGTKTQLNTTLALIWYEVNNTQSTEIHQLDVNPASLVTGLNSNVNILDCLQVTEEMTKVMLIQQADDTPVTLRLYHEFGLPHAALPVNTLSYPVGQKLVDGFDIWSFIDQDKHQELFVNELDFHAPDGISVFNVEKMCSCSYLKSLFVNSSGVVTEVNFRDPESMLAAGERPVESPWLHCYEDDGAYLFSVMNFKAPEAGDVDNVSPEITEFTSNICYKPYQSQEEDDGTDEEL